MNEQKITVAKTREEALANSAREDTADISFAALWMNAEAQAETLPRTPAKVTIRNSNTRTLEWQNQNAYWQHKRW